MQIETLVKPATLKDYVNYKSISLEKVTSVDAATSIDDMKKELGKPSTENIDSVIAFCSNVKSKAALRKDTSTYKVWKWETDRMKQLKNIDGKQTVYTVYKNTYLLGKRSQATALDTIKGYYFFDNNDNLIGGVTAEVYNYFKAQATKSGSQPYHLCQVYIQERI